MEDVAHIHRVVGRYANSYFDYRAAGPGKVKLMIYQHSFIFEIPGGHSYFRICAGLDIVRYSSHNDLLMLLESILTFRLLQSITALEFTVYYRGKYLFRASPLLAFYSMNSITVLNTCPAGLFYLGGLKQPQSLFPHLHTILMEKHHYERDMNRLRKWIQPFIAHRYHTAPIKVLKFEFIFHIPTDLRCLDTLSGLKVMGGVYGESPFEYVCGSGDAQCLYILADSGSNSGQ